MTRSQMIETVARKTGFTEAQVETTMDAMFDQIADCLRADEKVTIAGFGRFEMRPRKPKAYTNPKTKVSSRLESTSIPGFKASGRFKQKLEAGKAAKTEEAVRSSNQMQRAVPSTRGAALFVCNSLSFAFAQQLPRRGSLAVRKSLPLGGRGHRISDDGRSSLRTC